MTKRSLLAAPAVALGAAALAASGLAAIPAQAAPTGGLTDFGFDAASYGSKTTGNEMADSDATALSYLPCTRYVPRDDSNFVAEGGDGDGVMVRNVSTHNFSRQRDGVTSANSVVTIDSGSLAGGTVGFTNLTGRVKSFHNATGFHATTVSSLGSLSVAGVPITPPTDGQEMSVPVPGQGTLIINRQVKHVKPLSATGAVNVLRFVGDDGTIEMVGRAFSRIDGQIEGGLFGGAAWGSDARIGDVAALGRAALQPMPCPGTRGQIKESSTGEATLDFGFLGARRSFAYGVQRDNGSATGYTRSVVDSARFGGGVLQFRNIKARANVTRQADGDVIRDAMGTGVGTILVNGQEVAQPAAGVPQNVAGLGTFTVKTVQKDANGIDVTGVIVRLFNGTPKDKTDDTVVNLARAKLQIKKG